MNNIHICEGRDKCADGAALPAAWLARAGAQDTHTLGFYHPLISHNYFSKKNYITARRLKKLDSDNLYIKFFCFSCSYKVPL